MWRSSKENRPLVGWRPCGWCTSMEISGSKKQLHKIQINQIKCVSHYYLTYLNKPLFTLSMHANNIQKGRRHERHVRSLDSDRLMYRGAALSKLPTTTTLSLSKWWALWMSNPILTKMATRKSSLITTGLTLFSIKRLDAKVLLTWSQNSLRQTGHCITVPSSLPSKSANLRKIMAYNNLKPKMQRTVFLVR